MGKKFGDMTKTERIDVLKNHLFSHGSISLRYMLNEFRVSRKTALRDLEELGNQGIGIVEELLDNGDKRLSASFGSRKIPVTFTLEQIMSLFLGRQMFDFLEGTTFADSFNEVFSQIEKRLGRKADIDNVQKLQRKLYNVHEAPKQFSGQTTEILQTCMTALRHDKALVMEYSNFRGEVSNFTFHPYTLATFRRGLYLIGGVEEYNGSIRKLAVERIRNVQLTGIPVSVPESYSPKQYLQSALFFDTGDTQKVELLFRSGADAFIGLRTFHPSQVMKKHRDGTVTLTLDVHPGYEVLHWVLSFGSNVTVIRPAALAQKVKAELLAAAKSYQ